MKSVEADEGVDEDELEDLVRNSSSTVFHRLGSVKLVKAKEQHEQEYIEKAKENKAKGKVRDHFHSFSNQKAYTFVTGQSKSRRIWLRRLHAHGCRRWC